MPTLINKTEIIEDQWETCDLAQFHAYLSSPPEAKAVLLDWADWETLEQPITLPTNLKLGLKIPNTLDPELLTENFDVISLLAIEFPLFTDGRGYSQARMLREMGFTGEIRALGDVLPDQVFFMARCGIDTFALKEGHSPETAFGCFSTFTQAYQAAADGIKPVYHQPS